MPKNVLVAYATRSGSTQEITEAIASRLKVRGFDADLKPMKAVKDISGFDAFVLGAPMYMFHLINDAPKFLKRFQKVLVEKPVAFFSLGPINDKEEDLKGILENFDTEMAKFP